MIILLAACHTIRKWAPVYNDEMLTLINQKFAIDTIITHTVPDFCELINKNGLLSFAASDGNLFKDVEDERETMTKLYSSVMAFLY